MNALGICARNAKTTPIADPKPDRYRDTDSERLKTAMIFIQCKPESFRSDFIGYITGNFHVYKAFEREANRVWDRGRQHYSGRTIIEVLRHESALTDTDDVFRLNDWWTPDLCRLWMMFHPERDGFFETRSGVSAKRAI